MVSKHLLSQVRRQISRDLVVKSPSWQRGRRHEQLWMDGQATCDLMMCGENNEFQ